LLRLTAPSNGIPRMQILASSISSAAQRSQEQASNLEFSSIILTSSHPLRFVLSCRCLLYHDCIDVFQFRPIPASLRVYHLIFQRSKILQHYARLSKVLASDHDFFPICTEKSLLYGNTNYLILSSPTKSWETLLKFDYPRSI